MAENLPTVITNYSLPWGDDETGRVYFAPGDRLPDHVVRAMLSGNGGGFHAAVSGGRITVLPTAEHPLPHLRVAPRGKAK